DRSRDIVFEGESGDRLATLATRYESKYDLTPVVTITSGEENVTVDENGHIEALQPGDAAVQVKIPGLAANKGFLFIKALGRVGATNDDGSINFDIVGMVLFFGLSLYVNQLLSGQNSTTASSNPQQDTINKVTPVLFSGMFLFFPLPAGVLMYMVIANIFQTAQTFILSREPLPENLQKIVEEEERKAAIADGPSTLPFEPSKRSRDGNGKPATQTVDVKAKAQSSSSSRSSSKSRSKSSRSPRASRSKRSTKSAKGR
ncbi:MAG: hypothetical protein AB4042_09205, partial [Leptolyngbyaceae cyanobacterium]